LSNALYRIIDVHLPEFEDDTRILLRQRLLARLERRETVAHPIQWLNTWYAEDPEWWVASTLFLKKLCREIPAAHWIFILLRRVCKHGLNL
jgi:hypothetical protein